MAVHIIALTWVLDEGAWYLHALAASPLGKIVWNPLGRRLGGSRSLAVVRNRKVSSFARN
jgi:hypothetical protein